MLHGIDHCLEYRRQVILRDVPAAQVLDPRHFHIPRDEAAGFADLLVQWTRYIPRIQLVRQVPVRGRWRV